MLQRCIQCDRLYRLDEIVYTCRDCGAILEVSLDPVDLSHISLEGVGVWRYASLLPVDRTHAVTMHEGATGLHPCPRLGAELGMKSLFVKNEGENPTGSFKDRGMTVGVTIAVQLGAKAVACASTGNTAASMAAYAARSGLKAIVLVPGGHVALGKVAQSIVHGAKIVQVRGNFDDAMRLVVQLSTGGEGVYLLNSINPFRLEGQKTLAFEVCESLGRAPDVLVLPMGNAGNISAIWKGFREFHAAGRIAKLPKIIGVQAERAAPIVRTFRDHLDTCVEPNPETVATAIRIGAPVNWPKAITALRDSGGEAVTVSDEEILAAQRHLAAMEGIFVEPASAAPIAHLRKRRPSLEGTVVCVTTGHGLKDPDAILKTAPAFAQADATIESLRAALKS